MMLQFINLSLCVFYKFVYMIYCIKCEMWVGSSWVWLEQRKYDEMNSIVGEQ